MAVSGEGRSLEQTPTWAVATVCFVLVLISIIIEYVIHLIGKWFTKKHKRALYESLEKIKSELMLLGFISLLLTVGQGPISNICVSKRAGATWHPCSKAEEAGDDESSSETEHRRRLLSGGVRRVLAEATSDKCAAKGKVSFVSSEGIHQLHLFIFALALFHVLYCVLTMAFGRLKMKKWKSWEKETKTIEYEFSHDPERFRFARETSFGRRHLSLWTKTPILMWIACFFRQFVRSVPKVDYLTLRHGFVMAHLTPQSQTNFNFQKYINRSLEEDFKVVVGISPVIWLFAVLFLLFNTHGWYSYLWLPFIPLIIILLVGTKLQVIITKMGLRIQEGGEVLKGVPVVELGDHLFWFNSPRLLLYLINFVLFQNAFQLAFFAWTWYEFGLKSCFHEHVEDITIRISMGVLIQILCSYVTLPLYALVTQMGSTMKLTIFNDKVATALRNWHHTAKKHVKHNNKAGVTPMSSRPNTPSHHMSPAPLLGPHRSDMDSLYSSPPRSNVDIDNWDTDSPSPSHHHRYDGESSSTAHHQQGGNNDGSSSKSNHHDHGGSDIDVDEPIFSQEPVAAAQRDRTQHEVYIGSREFSFDRKSGVRFSNV